MVREGLTRPRGPSESPDGVDLNIRRKRHNVTVITVGSKYEVYVRSPASSHMQPFNNPFEPLQIKWEVNMLLKKSSCVLSSCVCRLSCVCYHCVGMYPVYICVFLHESADDNATILVCAWTIWKHRKFKSLAQFLMITFPTKSRLILPYVVFVCYIYLFSY